MSNPAKSMIRETLYFSDNMDELNFNILVANDYFCDLAYNGALPNDWHLYDRIEVVIEGTQDSPSFAIEGVRKETDYEFVARKKAEQKANLEKENSEEYKLYLGLKKKFEL